MEQRRQELAKHAVATAEKVLAKEQRLSLSAKMVVAEYNAQTIASWDATAVEMVNYVRTMGVMALTKLKATPKLRYGGPPLTQFSPPLTAKEVAKLNAATHNKQRQAVAQEKALVDKANKQCQAATLVKALANNTNKQRQVAAQKKALADKANERRRAAARDKALADKANEQCCHELAECAMTLATKALAKDEHNEDDNNVAWQFEVYAAPLFARVDVIMACCKPPSFVPYKGTYVPYDGTFGAPDQGQTLDV